MGSGVTMEILEAIHSQDMTSNVSVIHARLLLLNTITYRSGRKQNATKLGRPGANWWSGDFWKGVWCGFSCTGTCPIRAAAFVAGREHTYPIEECAEFCYCVFKGWTG